MKSYLFSTLVFFTIFISNAQELKTKKVQGPVYTEIFQINKETKKKQGEYLQILNFSKDTLAKGSYSNDSISGVWTYYYMNNHPYMKYDHSARVLQWVLEMASLPDSFLVRSQNGFVRTLVDRPPLFLGFQKQQSLEFANNIKLPGYLMEKGFSKLFKASFVVNKTGNIVEVDTDGIDVKEIRFWIDKVFRTNRWKYLPALMDGKPVDVKFFLLLDIGPSGPLPEITSKSDEILAHFRYFGIKRTIGSVSGAGNYGIGRNEPHR